MTTAKTLLIALTLALVAAAPAAQAQTPAPPRLAAGPILFVDPSLGEATVAIAFRTDAPLGRKSNGRSLDGGAGLAGAPHSIMTFSKARHCYLSFLGPRVKLHPGRLYAVDVDLEGARFTRTVRLQKRTTEAAIRHRLGC